MIIRRTTIFLLLILPMLAATVGPANAWREAAAQVRQPGGVPICVLSPIVTLQRGVDGYSLPASLIGQAEAVAAFCQVPSHSSYHNHANLADKLGEDVGSYQSGQVRRLKAGFSRVCGGIPGAPLSSAVMIAGEAANMSHLDIRFDPEGCVDLSNAATVPSEPLVPTALTMASVTAEGNHDTWTALAPLVLFAAFMGLTAGWVWMLYQKPARRSNPIADD